MKEAHNSYFCIVRLMNLVCGTCTEVAIALSV